MFFVNRLGARRHHLTSHPAVSAVVGTTRSPECPSSHDSGLLAAAAMSSAFTNTVFTQTVTFAADDFGVGNTGVGVAVLVRAGILITIPLAIAGDRIGRRKIVIAMAWTAPIVTATGALAPNFPFLVATQSIGRPLGLALDFLIAVIAAEEMPRGSRPTPLALWRWRAASVRVSLSWPSHLPISALRAGDGCLLSRSYGW